MEDLRGPDILVRVLIQRCCNRSPPSLHLASDAAALGVQRAAAMGAGAAATPERLCYKRWSHQLQAVHHGLSAAASRGPLQGGRPETAVLQAADAVAASGGRPCYKGCRSCCKGLAVDMVATSGGRPCYKRLPELLQGATAVASRGSRRAWLLPAADDLATKELSELLQEAGGVAPMARRRVAED
jgi:hypothetical protein